MSHLQTSMLRDNYVLKSKKSIKMTLIHRNGSDHIDDNKRYVTEADIYRHGLGIFYQYSKAHPPHP